MLLLCRHAMVVRRNLKGGLGLCSFVASTFFFNTTDMRSKQHLEDIKSSLANKMLVSLTVGKVDAGVAVLLTEDKRLVSQPRKTRTATSHG